jgi:glyoxylase-like metal-dependent hydrolase (beta-lactamase superfamily II)
MPSRMTSVQAGLIGGDGGEATVGSPEPHWTEPGIYEVAPGVHRVPLPLPSDALRAVNVYVIVDGDDLVLVDSGWALAESRELLAKGLAELGAGLGDVSQFLVTHVHRDHYSQAVELRREFGSRIALGEGERASMEELTRPGRRPMSWQGERLRQCGAHALLEQLTKMVPPKDHTPYEEPDGWLSPTSDAGLSTRSLRVVPTPGHTQGHVVFADEAGGLLFAGDHVLPHITPSIGFEPAQPVHPLRSYLESLRLVRTMPDLRLLPAHGPVTPSAHERIDELLTHHDNRLKATGDAVGDGPTTAYQVARSMTWTRRERRLDDLDVFNQTLAILETAAHLDLLVLRGELTTREEGGEIGYLPGGSP